jgi:hypothetical protein
MIAWVRIMLFVSIMFTLEKTNENSILSQNTFLLKFVYNERLSDF